MPLQRRLPKRGFRNPFRKEVEIVNLKSLNRFPAGSTVDPATLAQAGLTRAEDARVKVLGDGELDRGLTVKAHAFSATAKAAIEAKGGSAEVLA
jgi:large subunit ribosomal protein L15